MTNITHEALVSRGFQRHVRNLSLRLSKFIIVFDDEDEDFSLYDKEDESVIIVPNCRTLADLDNLIKLFV